MGRVGRTIFVFNIIGIPVIGNDHHLIAVATGGFNDLAHTGIYSFHGTGDRLTDSGVSHHITVGKIETHKRRFLLVEFRDERIRDLRSTHLGFQVVGGHPG